MVDSIAFTFSTLQLVNAAAASFVILLLGAVFISPHNRLPGRGKVPFPNPSLWNAPILQIELARNERDLTEVLNQGNLRQNLEEARVGNLLDTFLFVPAYVVFLSSIGLLLA